MKGTITGVSRYGVKKSKNGDDYFDVSIDGNWTLYFGTDAKEMFSKLSRGTEIEATLRENPDGKPIIEKIAITKQAPAEVSKNERFEWEKINSKQIRYSEAYKTAGEFLFKTNASEETLHKLAKEIYDKIMEVS